MRNILHVVSVSFALLLSVPAFAGNELVHVDVRPGVSMKMMILEPESKSKGVLLLYSGGMGTLELSSFFGRPTIGNSSYANNFLVRVRDKFVDQGFVVALPDVPTDRKKLDYQYRLGDAQVIDTKATVAYLKNRYGLPVWLVGTSSSSLSVAHAANHVSDQISGIILTASVTQVPSNYAVYADFPEGTASTNLPALKLPVLIVSNTEDACSLSPSADSELIKSRLTNSPRVKVRYFSGGDTPRSDPCNALSRHGFLGIENEVVASILEFVDAR
ncbi:MAG: hypothetical protein IV085_09045 [Thiobacillus sp.]|nr:hypothetical protein [Thiobacillus sp.]